MFPIVLVVTVVAMDVVVHVAVVQMGPSVTLLDNVKIIVFLLVPERLVVAMVAEVLVVLVLLDLFARIQPVLKHVVISFVIPELRTLETALKIVLVAVTEFVIPLRQSILALLIVPSFVEIMFVKVVKRPITVLSTVLTFVETVFVNHL